MPNKNKLVRQVCFGVIFVLYSSWEIFCSAQNSASAYFFSPNRGYAKFAAQRAGIGSATYKISASLQNLVLFFCKLLKKTRMRVFFCLLLVLALVSAVPKRGLPGCPRWIFNLEFNLSLPWNNPKQILTGISSCPAKHHISTGSVINVVRYSYCCTKLKVVSILSANLVPLFFEEMLSL